MVDYGPSHMILLGGAFASFYWTTYTVATIFKAIDRGVLLVAGVLMVLAWPVVAGYVAVQTLRSRDNLLRETLEQMLSWVVFFGGVAILVTWSVGGLGLLVWGQGPDTTLWFGMVTVTTILAGALVIGLAGVVTRVVRFYSGSWIPGQ